MATKSSSSTMKGFYRQKKASGGITKPSPKTSKKKTLSNRADIHLTDDYDKNEDVLKQFDMNIAYGPCLGMTRLARWERAHRLGLNPPKEIEGLLKEGKVQAGCLWDGRI